MAGKAPAFQFYVKDWLSDVELKMASYTSKGIWIDILCYMWTSKIRGEISGSAEKIRQMVGCDRDEIIQFIDDVREFRFCYEVTDDNGKITLRNRRMYGEEKAKQDNKLRQQKHRDKQKSNKKVTPYSPSPSPSPKKKKGIKKEFIAPNIKDVIQYFQEKGYSIKAAKKAFNYYDVAGWKDSKGNKVKNWKQKMQGVWFKDENIDQSAQGEREFYKPPIIPEDEIYKPTKEDISNLRKITGGIGGKESHR